MSLPRLTLAFFFLAIVLAVLHFAGTRLIVLPQARKSTPPANDSLDGWPLGIDADTL